MKIRVAIVDYGVGNIGSIANMLKKVGQEGVIANSTTLLENATHFILPGVGAFDYGMQALKDSGLLSTLEKKVLKQNHPFLGVCLGAQMLGRASEEGKEQGLGWLPFVVKRFSVLPPLRVPHMGWNVVVPIKDNHLLQKAAEELRFYFVHSYYMQPDEASLAIGQTPYGHLFVSAVGEKNIFGVQFHPEKSHRFGAALLKQFSELVPC